MSCLPKKSLAGDRRATRTSHHLLSEVGVSNIREQMKSRVVVIAAGIALLLMGYSKPSQIRRVIVSAPDHWSAGENRDCVLAGDDPVRKLPNLDCDLPASDTRQSQMFVMDVKFSTTPERQQYVEWTCRRTSSSLDCGN